MTKLSNNLPYETSDEITNSPLVLHFYQIVLPSAATVADIFDYTFTKSPEKRYFCVWQRRKRNNMDIIVGYAVSSKPMRNSVAKDMRSISASHVCLKRKKAN